MSFGTRSPSQVLKSAVDFHNADFVSKVQRAVENTCDRQPAEVVAIVQIRDENLERPCGVTGRLRNRFQNRLEQRP